MKKIAVPARTSLIAKVGAVIVFAGLVATSAACSVTADTTATDTCGINTALTCVTGSTGYSCTGADRPEAFNSTLTCSVDTGTGNYCCSVGGTNPQSGCSADTSLSCGGATGYSCTSGSAAPDATDATLVCSTPTIENGLDEYCCYTDTNSTTGTCVQDPSIVGCQANANGTPSYGFSCTGSDTPDQDYSNITCSTPTETSGAEAYCCVYN